MNYKYITIVLLVLCTFAQAEQLENIVVDVDDSNVSVAKNEIDEIRHSPMPVSVIDAKRFHGRNISLNEVIKRAAGVRLKQQGGLGSRSTIAIHGLEGKRVKLFLDGSPINAPDGTFGINDIPIQLIERIEVYKGVVPARFGGDALGGAVNVVTIDPEGSYYDFTTSIASYGEQRITALVKEKFDKYNLQIGGGVLYSKADNDYMMESPFVKGLKIKRDNAKYKSLVLAFVGNVKEYWFDQITWEIVRYTSDKEIQGIKSYIGKAKNKSTFDVAAFRFEKEKFLFDNLALDYKFLYGELTLNHIDKARTCFNFDGSTRNCPGYGIGELTGVPHDSKDKQEEFRHDLNLHYVINNEHAINFHLNSQDSTYKPNDPLATKYLKFDAGKYPSKSTNTIVSLSYESNYLDKKLVNDMGIKYYKYDYDIIPNKKLAGLNIETNKHKGNEFGFYESIRYEPIKNLYVKASYEHAFRLPNNSEIFGDGGYIRPAPNLIPEEADNFNFSVLFDSYDFRDFQWFKAEASVFHKKLKNMIKLQPGANAAGYVNVGEVEVKGFELEANVEFDENWYVYANYTNQTLVDKLKYESGSKTKLSPTYNLDIPNVPNQYANFGVEYMMTDVVLEDSYLKLFWEGNWADEYFYGYELSRFQSRKIDAQISHTLGLEYTFNDDKTIFSLEVHNVTDEKITDVFNYPLMGRTYHFNLRYTWL